MQYALKRLMFAFLLGTLRADDFHPGLADWIVRKLASIARRAAARTNRVAAPASGAESVATASVAGGDGRSVSLGVAVSFVARMANRARHRQTGNRHRVASSRLPLFWTWKSRRRIGRPTVAADVRALIRTMSEANPLWGAPRIHGELLKLGIDVSQATVAKYVARPRQPPSQTWRTFLRNHIGQIVAADFFVVPTATCRLLFVLVILAHERRRVVHVGVTDHPTAVWTAQQLRAAFPWNDAPRYLVRDRDSAFARVGHDDAGNGHPRSGHGRPHHGRTRASSG